MRLSMRGRLGASHALVAILAVALVAIAVVLAGSLRFNSYATAVQDQRTQNVVDAITGGYHAGSGWDPSSVATVDMLAAANSIRVWVYGTDGSLQFAAGNMANMMQGSGMMGGSSGSGGSGTAASPPRAAARGKTLQRISLTAAGQPIGTALIVQPSARGLPLNTALRKDLALYLALAGVLAALIAVTIGILATRRITAPLEAVTAAAAAMGRGERRQRAAAVYAERPDEVGALASSFNEMAESIEHQEEWRRSMTADLAHELRTPLATIQARIEALQDGVLPADPENLAVIGDEVARLGRLLTGLRSLDDMDAADFALERRPLRLDDVASEAVAAAGERFAQKDVRLTIETQPVEVLGDRDRLRQVVDNLLDNALKFTAGGGRVEVRVAASAASPVAELSVADDGRGIPPDDLPHVFERFYRGDGARKSAPGAGLGLAIVSRLVEAHGGSIRAESDGRSGSRFTVDLRRLDLSRPKSRAGKSASEVS